MLGRVHEQLGEIDARFLRRVEAIDLSKQAPMDLARGYSSSRHKEANES